MIFLDARISMKLRLNLATSPLENNRRFLLTTTLAALIAFASLLTLGATAFSNWRANRNLRVEISQLESEMRDFRTQRRDLEDFFKQPATRQMTDRAAFLNALIDQRSFPWTQIFTALEKRLPPGVHVVSLAPRMQDGRVQLRLVFGAADDDAKLRFLRTLEEAPEFSRVQLVSETRPKSGDTSDAVQIEISAVYAATEKVQKISAEESEPADSKSAPVGPRKATSSAVPSPASQTSASARRQP
jgi:Tfp pilus assembly protein PilN